MSINGVRCWGWFSDRPSSGSSSPRLLGVRVRGSFCECGASKCIYHLIWVLTCSCLGYWHQAGPCDSGPQAGLSFRRPQGLRLLCVPCKCREEVGKYHETDLLWGVARTAESMLEKGDGVSAHPGASHDGLPPVCSVLGVSAERVCTEPKAAWDRGLVVSAPDHTRTAAGTNDAHVLSLCSSPPPIPGPLSVWSSLSY